MDVVAGEVACAGGIVFDGLGRLLLIRRGHEPAMGYWSLPGGRRLAGEDAETACVREVAEETGLTVRVLRRAGRVHRAGDAGFFYDIEDFVCEAVGGTLRAGDDADRVRWVSRAELPELRVAGGVLDALAGWDLLPE
jgi:ADP-ribose pyrophosphatase YjhB (NUDIX family)